MCFLNINSFLQTSNVHFNRVRNKANDLFRVWGDLLSPYYRNIASKPKVGNESK